MALGSFNRVILFAANNPFRFRARYRKELNLIVRNVVGHFKTNDPTNYSIDINDQGIRGKLILRRQRRFRDDRWNDAFVRSFVVR